MRRLIGIATLAVLMAGTAFAQNLVTNGGFEAGTAAEVGNAYFPGWNQINNADQGAFIDDCTYGTTCAFAGTYMAEFGEVGDASGIYQSIGTIAGHTYHVSFWLANDDGCDPNRGCFTSINVSFGGVTLINDSLQHPYGWTFEEFDVLASGSSSDLSFLIRQDPSYYYLDNVNVVDETPEPASLTLLGSALGLGAGFVRKFRS